ncbi:helix-turn-helix domain-containing protein [Nocardia rhizosphaerihabitans]|uniref:helix-turn-helix domain-containing protein n=1 Tax=Nocardia rhizosphaerihabitans TaxID=1691570 RepID=UPI00366A58EA
MPSFPRSSPDEANADVSLPVGETWLTSSDLAARWNIPLKTIASWASAGTGPRYSRLGRYRRYRLAAVRAWEHQRLIDAAPADPTPPAAPSVADDETWLTTTELAQRLQIPARTLAGWASTGIGPRYARLGRHRRYRLADLRVWEHQRENASPLRDRRTLH